MIDLDAYKKTKEGLQKILLLQQAMRREVYFIRSKEYIRRGSYQITIDESVKKIMIADVENKCNSHCSNIYDEINQVRVNEGLHELINHYKERN